MRERASLPDPGDTIAGKYVLERVIGQGGMSVVYGATHRVTGKRFAIKWLLPDEATSSGDTVRRFIREAQVAGLFEHPNVVEVYDVGQISDSFYMVMEWLEGESLAARLDRVGAMSFEEVCAYLIPCMHGVLEAHAVGIVHRDLKPANIFLCRAMHHTPERPKVLDFGIAKLSEQTFSVNSVVTKSGVLIGTPHYLSPEQLRSLPIDHRTDIYALGVILYQLLSGQLPFPADNFGALVLQIATGTPLPLRDLAPDLPAGADAIVERAMAREPDDRFQDVRQLIDALEQLSSPGLGPISGYHGRPSLTPRPPRPSADPVPPLRSPTPTSAPLPQPMEAGPSRNLLAYLTLAAAAAALISGLSLLVRLWNQPPSAADRRAPTQTIVQPAPVPITPVAEPTTTTSAVQAPRTEAAEPPPPASATVQGGIAAGRHEAANAPRVKRPARASPPPSASPTVPPAPLPAAPLPAPAPPPEHNPLDMQLQ